MLWPFSLPPSLPKRSRYLGFYPINRLNHQYKHIIVMDYPRDEECNIDYWCQLNFCYYFYDRVSYDPWGRSWYSDGLGGFDCLIICTNDDSSATMAMLRWQQ